MNVATPGGLYPAVTITDLKTTSNLKITGTIDARDFKTLRDDMPVLKIPDLGESNIVA